MHESNEWWLDRLRKSGADQQQALSALRELLMVRLRSTFRGQSGVDDAFLEDVTQEALLKILDKLDQFQGNSRFTTWATTIAVRVAFTQEPKKQTAMSVCRSWPSLPSSDLTARRFPKACSRSLIILRSVPSVRKNLRLCCAF